MMYRYTYVMVRELTLILLIGVGFLGILLEGHPAAQGETIVRALAAVYAVLSAIFIYGAVRTYVLDEQELRDTNLLGMDGTVIRLGTIRKVVCETGEYERRLPLPYWRLRIVYTGGETKLQFGSEEQMARFLSELRMKAGTAQFLVRNKNEFYTMEIRALGNA